MLFSTAIDAAVPGQPWTQSGNHNRMMPLSERLKLSVLIFLQYFISATSSSRSAPRWDKRSGSVGDEIGLVAGTTALAAIISPFFVGMVANRFLATNRSRDA